MTAAPFPRVADSAAASRPQRNTPGFSEALAWKTSSRANWLWLIPVPDWELALELSPPGSKLPGALDEHFTRVEHLPLDRSALAARLPFDDATLDCVALHDAAAALASASADTLLAECYRILKPGGWLYVGMPNDASFARARRSPGAWAMRFVRELMVPASRRHPAIHRAGFAQVRRYFAWPSEASQRMLIPAERSAAVAHERLDRIASNRGRLRAAIAGLGMYAGLYPVRIFLCRR